MRIPDGFDIFHIMSLVIGCLKYLKTHQYDIIYTRVPLENIVGCLILSRLIKKPLIIEIHRHTYETGHYGIILKWKKILENLALSGAKKIVVNSLSFKKHLVSKHRINPAKIAPVYNCYDNELFNAKKTKIPSYLSPFLSRPTVGFVGYFKEDEDLACLAEAAKLVIEKFPETIFIMTGDGPQRVPFEKKIKSLGIEKDFLMLGTRPHAEIPGILASLNVFVALRKDSDDVRFTIPIKIIEAMAIGTPLVVTASPAIEEATENVAILVPPGDKISVAKAIMSLLIDAEARANMSSMENEIVSKFARDKIVSVLIRTLKEAFKSDGE